MRSYWLLTADLHAGISKCNELLDQFITIAFQEHGEIEEGAVIYDKATGKSRGYGFVTYKDMESAQRALKAPSKMIDGRMAVCNLASEGLSSTSVTPDQAQRKLYIGGLSPETNSEMLLSFFSRHGEIEEGSVAYDKETNKSRGFGFVTYRTVEAAKKAIDDPQKMLGGRNITVKLADNYKGKVPQPQLPASVVPVPVHMTAGYQQTGGGAPIGYTYPQPMASYPTASYTSPPTGAAPYSAQPQYSYPQYGVKKETPQPQTALGGYPYYMPKQ
ncbi:UBP1-associated protein 2A-like isoform X2 [Sesamum indicum]|uniref:UBP1-associated protein 2A-like isoform X2 n=1 Tax=Sesamum indicum TaxID=4182 RepID=A0A6I9T981_SESIN|nr:UBP1-associated protein 2A-like isoform X2 [Sesamum indicum]